MSIWFVVIVGFMILCLIIGIVILALRMRGTSGLFSDGFLRIDEHHGRTPIKPAESFSVASQAVDMRKRLNFFRGITAASFGILLVRLWGVQFVLGKQYSEQANQNATTDVSLQAVRGRILDRNGNILVGNRSCLALVADKSAADDSKLLRRLSNLIGMPEVAVRHNIQSTSEGAQSLRTIMVDVPDSAVAYVAEHASQFPGISIESRSVRTYPYGEAACHLLGYTGTISSDELAAWSNDEDNLIDYQYGDTVGKNGIEYQYERVLQGIRGTRSVYVDASGDVLGVASEIEPQAGSDVRLSIDIEVQKATEEGLAIGVQAGQILGYEPTGAACVCMNCKTGEILSMASYPSYDPSVFIGGVSTDVWYELIAEESNNPLLNRAINGLYPSASTIKPFTACAALEYNMVNLEDTVRCTGYWTGFGDDYGMSCWNHDGHGYMNLYEGIVNSCDVVFYEIAKSFYNSENSEGIQEMFRRWGLGSVTGVDLAAESYGRVPDSQWKWDYFTWYDDSDRIWQGGDTANISIGQGDILVTPMQMCYVYSGLVNRGKEMWPHILLEVLSGQTSDPVIEASAHEQVHVDISSDILDFVLSALYGVVNESSIRDYFAGLPVSVIGKSGTGEAGDDENNTHAWFCAAAPAEDPTYVVAAIVEHGGGGSDVASHVCRSVLGAVYGADPLDSISVLRSKNVSTTQVMD